MGQKSHPYFRWLHGVALAAVVAAASSGAAARAEAPTGRASTSTPTGLSPEDTKREVRRLVREAGQLMDRGDRAGAIERLLQARRLQPDPTLDYNLGVAYAESGQPIAAAESLQRFLGSADAGSVLSERLEDARQRQREYERTLGRLTVHAGVPTGVRSPSLCLDQAPCQPLGSDGTSATQWLLPGTHSVRVAAAGARDYLVQVELKPGELRQLTGELRPLGDGQAELIPSTPEALRAAAPAPVYKKWWFWTAVGGGAAVLLAVVAAGASGAMDRVAPGSDLDPVDVAR
ncbi:MAG: hypothetical protein U1A78_39760 [Polyangia bacterium]